MGHITIKKTKDGPVILEMNAEAIDSFIELVEHARDNGYAEAVDQDNKKFLRIVNTEYVPVKVNYLN